MALPGNNYFEQMLGTEDPFVPPALQSPYPGLQMTPDFGASAEGSPGPQQAPYEGMTPEAMAMLSDSAGTNDMARSVAGSPYQEPENAGPTPWVAKVLGGLQDALAVISHAKNPNSKAQFGGFANAMFAKSEYNRGARNRNTARVEKHTAEIAEIGKAIALRKITEQMTGAKDRSTETERMFDYLRKQGKSEEFIQELALSQLPGTQQYEDVLKKKNRNMAVILADLKKDMAAGEPGAQENYDFLKQSMGELSDKRVDESTAKARGAAPYRQTTQASDNANSIPPSESLKIETEPLRMKLEAAKKDLATVKKLNIDFASLSPSLRKKLGGGNEKLDEAQKTVDDLVAEISKVNATFKTRGKKAGASSTDEWGDLEVR